MRLPEPLTMVDALGITSYVMRREAGAELGAIALRRRRSGLDVMFLLERAVRFLARFHAWRGVRAETLVQATLREFVRQVLRKLERTSGFSPVESAKVADYLWAASVFAIPSVPKKDAHGENWLVTPGDAVVMLDLEAKGSERLPVIYEVAQLVEDQGLLAVDVAGWGMRRELANIYLDELERAGSALQITSMVERAYNLFALIRAVISIPSVDRRAISRDSESSVVRARAHRADHYRALVEAIRSRSAGSDLGEAASTIALWLAEETRAN